MSPEMQMQLSNVMSILEKIQSMYANEGMDMDNNMDMMDAEKQDMDNMDMMDKKKQDMMDIDKAGYTDEEMKTEKALEMTEADASDANDDAEDRIDETNTEITEDSVNEVAKTLLALAGKKKVKKSEKSDNSNMVQAINQLTTVVKSLANKQNETETAVNGILKGLGVSEQLQEIQKAEQAKAADNRTPVMNPDANEMVQLFKSMMLAQNGQSNQDNQLNNVVTSNAQSDVVRKNCNDIAREYMRKGRF